MVLPEANSVINALFVTSNFKEVTELILKSYNTGAINNYSPLIDKNKKQTILDLPYGTNPYQKLDVYLPANHNKNTRTIFFIHGGGWNDPRVIAWQPGKFAAALQNASSSGKPVLMKVNYDNGHFTEDKDVKFANFADQFAFVLWQCGHPGFRLKSN